MFATLVSTLLMNFSFSVLSVFISPTISSGFQLFAKFCVGLVIVRTQYLELYGKISGYLSLVDFLYAYILMFLVLHPYLWIGCLLYCLVCVQ